MPRMLQFLPANAAEGQAAAAQHRHHDCTIQVGMQAETNQLLHSRGWEQGMHDGGLAKPTQQRRA